MRVAVITPRYPPTTSGGGEISAQLLAKHLRRFEETEVHVYSFDGKSRTDVDGVPVTRLGNPPSLPEISNPYAYVKLRNELSSDEYDVLHAYNMELHPVTGYLSDLTGIPSVATLNAYTFLDKRSLGMEISGNERVYNDLFRPTTGRLLKRGVRRIDALIALSNAVKDIYERNGFGDSRINLIYNMMDPSVGNSHSSATDGGVSGDDGSKTLLFVGSLSPHKGVEYLVRALTYLPDDFGAKIVGTGDREEALKRLAFDLDVHGRVEFAGTVPYEKIGEVYTSADVFVHPGVWPEPLNRTLLEAVQLGLPPVCTNVGGPPEVVQDEELLCEPRNPRDLARAVRYAAENRERLGERHREYVVENHHPSNIVPRIVDLYRDVNSAG